MSLEYDDITSFHYKAYRPALHQWILEKLFASSQNNFENGLDVGCGTGYSSVALSQFTEMVTGIDISEAMLSQATPQADIDYQHFDGQTLDFHDDRFDVITFAGSLFYAKSQELLDEIIRVSIDKAQIIVYDFEVLLQPILEKLGLELSTAEYQNYNHSEDFSGLNTNHLTPLDSKAIDTSFDVSLKNVVHLILSEKKNYQYFSKSLGKENLTEKLEQQLQTIYKNDSIQLSADIYFTVYQVEK